MKPRFSIDAIRQRAGDKVFARGEAYFQDGQVEILDVTPARVLARVSGNEDYRTILTGKGTAFGGECSCPAYEQSGFCKHMVAVALAAIHAAPQRDGSPLEDIRKYLLTKDAGALVGLILDLAERDDVLFRQLEMEAVTASDDDKTALSRLRKALTAATRTGGFVHYREAGEWASGVEAALDHVAALVPAGRAAIARPLAEHALARIEAAIENIDDSDGYCSELLAQARDIHLAACRAAPPEPVQFARDLFAREMADDWGAFTGAFELYADVLGEAGRAEYRRLATDAWDKIPRLAGTRRATDEVSPERERERLAGLLDAFAADDGDVDARIALRAHTLTSPWRYLGLAQFCRDQGREAEALRHAEEGLWLFKDDPPDERLVAFAAGLHQAAGRIDQALAVLRPAFEQQPSMALYQRLRDLGGEAERGRAIAVLTARLAKAPPKARWLWPADLLVNVLMSETMFAEAWDTVRTHGASPGVVQTLAELSETNHPRDALVAYAARVEQLASTGGNPNYQEACRLIARMAALRDAAEQAAYLADVKVRFKAKRNFMKMLGP